jgi:hypothetical protein
MKMNKIVGIALGLVIAGSVALRAEVTLPPSVFNRQLQELKFEYSVYNDQQPQSSGLFDQAQSAAKPKRLSPGRAFAYSLLVPGLGQFYNGSKAKAAGFFALDVASWVFHFKHYASGNDKTAEFEKFQQTNWKLSRYENKYLLWVYGKTDDDSISGFQEISHHLPDTRTQQYYEMTGKYDQFSWGWIDATYTGDSIDYFAPPNPAMPAITNHQFAPQSAMRQQYEGMRFDANHQFSVANRWVIISLANHVVSAFEAFLTARHKNGRNPSGGGFGRIKVKADLRSFYVRRDTPYVSFSYAL